MFHHIIELKFVPNNNRIIKVVLVKYGFVLNLFYCIINMYYSSNRTDAVLETILHNFMHHTP